MFFGQVYLCILSDRIVCVSLDRVCVMLSEKPNGLALENLGVNGDQG